MQISFTRFLQAKDVAFLQPNETLNILVQKTLVEKTVRFSSEYFIWKFHFKELPKLIKLMINLYDDNLVVNLANLGGQFTLSTQLIKPNYLIKIKLKLYVLYLEIFNFRKSFS